MQPTRMHVHFSPETWYGELLIVKKSTFELKSTESAESRRFEPPNGSGGGIYPLDMSQIALLARATMFMST